MNKLIIAGIVAATLVGGAALATSDNFSSDKCHIGNHNKNVLFEKQGCYKPTPTATPSPSVSVTVTPSPSPEVTTTPIPTPTVQTTTTVVLPDVGGTGHSHP